MRIFKILTFWIHNSDEGSDTDKDMGSDRSLNVDSDSDPGEFLSSDSDTRFLRTSDMDSDKVMILDTDIVRTQLLFLKLRSLKSFGFFSVENDPFW